MTLLLPLPLPLLRFFRFSWFLKSSFEDNGISEIHLNNYRNTPKGLQKYTQTVTGIHPKDYRNTPKRLQKYTQRITKLHPKFVEVHLMHNSELFLFLLLIFCYFFFFKNNFRA
ncbi:uncharacterized protein DS421_12g372680 [Arachis hypogaea]|nr:uncharacterized protein DS421_12g372680 [Arachis hypogaea]